MGLNLVSTFYLWVFCNHLFHQPLFLYFSILGIEIWFRQRKCSFVEKNSFASFAILLKFQEDTEKDYVNNSTLLDFYSILPSGSTVTWRGRQCLKLQTFLH